MMGIRLQLEYSEADSIGPDVGAAAIYSWDGSNWAEINMVFGSVQDSRFGRYMDLSNDGQYLVIGSPHNDLNGSNSGAVYSYAFNGAFYETLNDTLFGSPSDEFGGSVAINSDGSRLAVGSPKWSDGVLDSIGKVEFYDRSVDVWNATGVDFCFQWASVFLNLVLILR